MNSKMMDSGSKDFISNLPDALICHILSFLPTKDAALTYVLSKRWRYLLADVPILDLDNSIYDYRQMCPRRKIDLRESFRVFVDRVMTLQGNATLKKFALRCKIDYDPSYVNAWILNVLQRNVVEIDLYTSKYNYLLPPQVLMSNTLVRLTVASKDELTIDVREVFLPKLETLNIRNVSFQGDSGVAFQKLISGCQALEELTMNIVWDFQASFSLSNPNLKKVIYNDNGDDYQKRVSFDTPNLLYLEFSQTVAAEYPKVNLHSLVEASICLMMTSDQLVEARHRVAHGHSYSLAMTENAADFLMGLSNVQILTLPTHTLEVLAFCCRTIPVFNNLIHLTIGTDEDVEWKALPNFLHNCPNLKTLIFEGLQCIDTYWMRKAIIYIRSFVETMPHLQEVILCYDTTSDEEDLGMIPIQFQKFGKVASSKCKIHVISGSSSSGLLDNTFQL